MSRIPGVDPATATGAAAELLSAVQSTFGSIPNFAKVMANSPALLKGYLQLSSAFGAATLSWQVRELIAICVAEANRCAYCLSAHIFFVRAEGNTSDAEIEAARHADSPIPRIRAILQFASAVHRSHGNVTDAALAEIRGADVSDEEILEIVGCVTINVLTNYANNLSAVEIDFPVVTPGQPLDLT